jgi:uncharacterized protein (DUF983 family)
MTAEKRFALFFAVWAVLAIGSALFYWRAPLPSKRLWHPRIVIGSGFVFATFVAMLLPAWPALLITLPGVALITYLNIRFTTFCPACGTMQFNRNWFAKMEFCQSCGASLREGDVHA